MQIQYFPRKKNANDYHEGWKEGKEFKISENFLDSIM